MEYRKLPFDDIQGLLFANPSLVRAAKLFYEDQGKEEIILVPLIYGASWLTNNTFDQDGTMTRFCCNLRVEEFDRYVGIGIGHQDLLLTDAESKSEQTLVGLGSITVLRTDLELNDPRFDQKCKSRGLDPSVVRKQVAEELNKRTQ